MGARFGREKYDHSGTAILQYDPIRLGDSKIVLFNSRFNVLEAEQLMISLYRDMAYNNILQVESIKSISFQNMIPVL